MPGLCLPMNPSLGFARGGPSSRRWRPSFPLLSPFIYIIRPTSGTRCSLSSSSSPSSSTYAALVGRESVESRGACRAGESSRNILLHRLSSSSTSSPSSSTKLLLPVTAFCIPPRPFFFSAIFVATSSPSVSTSGSVAGRTTYPHRSLLGGAAVAEKGLPVVFVATSAKPAVVS